MNKSIQRQVEEELKRTISLSEEEFRNMQQERFLEHIHKMYDNSREWRDLLDKHNIKEREELPASLSEISKLPIVDRSFLLEWSASGERIVSPEKRYCTINTSGTSGSPLNVDYSRQAAEIGWGLLGLRTLILMGIDLEEKGIMLTALDEKTGKSHSSHINTLALKKHLGEGLIDQPITRPLNESMDLMISEKVSWIGTVPVFFNASVLRAKERGIDLKKLGIKTLFYGGVGFPEHLKERVEDGYGAKVLGFYPSTELCAAGTQAGKQDYFSDIEENEYILYSDWIVFEFLDDDDKHVSEGEVGRIVATPMFMDSTPLVRYDIGDKARFHGCKGNFPIISDIRRSNAIYFSNGKFHHYEVEEMQKKLAERTGITISGLQVAKVLGDKDVELPIIRIETKKSLDQEQKSRLTDLAISLFRQNEHVDIMIKRGIHGGVHHPVVEFYPFRALVPEGSFKPKLASDETGFWSSYAFYQNRVQRHMSPIRQLADRSVEQLDGCKSVVDIASGAGYFSSRFAEAGMKVEAVDYDHAMLHYAKRLHHENDVSEKVTYRKASADSTGLPTGSKEAVHISNFLCHIDEPDAVLDEASRILKDGGLLSLGEPSRRFGPEAIARLREVSEQDIRSSPEIGAYFPTFVEFNRKMTADIKSLFSSEEMQEKLKACGFDVVSEATTYEGSAYHLLAKRYRHADYISHVRRMQKLLMPIDDRHEGRGLLLDLNERTRQPSEPILHKILSYVADGRINRYSGKGDLKRKIASYANTMPEEIMLTNGSYHAIEIVTRSLLRRGDNVVMPIPAFEAFGHSIRLQQARVKGVEHDAEGNVDVDDIIAKIDGRTRMIVICNPSNPYGTMMSKEDIQKLLKVSKKISVLVDEAYFEFSRQTVVDLIARYPNLIVTRTFSKAFGLAGLRIGYVLSNQENIDHLARIAGPFDVNTVAQVAASACLDNIDDMEMYRDEVVNRSRPYLERFFSSKGISFVKSDANFIFVRMDEGMHEKLREEGIRVSCKKDKSGSGLRIAVPTLTEARTLVRTLRKIMRKDHITPIRIRKIEQVTAKN